MFLFDVAGGDEEERKDWRSVGARFTFETSKGVIISRLLQSFSTPLCSNV